MDEVAVATQCRLPFVLVMLNNAYMGLIRQGEKYRYDMNYGFDGAAGANGIDHVLAMESMGATGVRVTEPGDIGAALEWAIDESERRAVPALVEIIIDREADASMGPAIDDIREYLPQESGQPAVAS
jgi:tartronate-semialdehyde synthase